MTDITIPELKDLIEREKIEPSKLFDKEDFKKDKKLIKWIAEKEELEELRAEKKKKKEEEGDASHIPDDDFSSGGGGGSSGGGEADHIPD